MKYWIIFYYYCHFESTGKMNPAQDYYSGSLVDWILEHRGNPDFGYWLVSATEITDVEYHKLVKVVKE